MAPKDNLDVLLARLQVQMPELRSVLVTTARESDDGSDVALDLTECLARRGGRVCLLTVGRHTVAPSSVRDGGGPTAQREKSTFETLEASVQQVSSADAARRLLESQPAMTVASAGGMLDSAAAVFLSAAADAVILAVRGGKTLRADVDRAHAEIRASGGKLVAAVLQDG